MAKNSVRIVKEQEKYFVRAAINLGIRIKKCPIGGQNYVYYLILENQFSVIFALACEFSSLSGGVLVSALKDHPQPFNLLMNPKIQ